MGVDKEKLYTDYKYRLFVAKNLLAFADEALKGGLYYQNKDEIKVLILSKDFNNKLLKNFILQYLFENIRISTFIENFIKAYLLLNDKIVHNIDWKLDSILHKKQNKEPLSISSIVDLKILKSTTIGLSVIQKDTYLNITGLDKVLMKKLIPTFGYRNNLHFYIGEEIINLNNFIEIFEKILKLSQNNINTTIYEIENLRRTL